MTVLLLRRSILTEKIARRGQHITREYGIDPFEYTRACDIMIDKVDTLPADMRVDEASAFFATTERTHRVYPVIDGAGLLKGVVTRGDALLWQQDPALTDQTLDERVSDTSVPIAHPEDTIGYVADLMLATDVGRIPVVDPETGRLLGLVARKDLLRLRHAANASENERKPYLGPGKAVS